MVMPCSPFRVWSTIQEASGATPEQTQPKSPEQVGINTSGSVPTGDVQ
jgi:hypothetical protein